MDLALDIRRRAAERRAAPTGDMAIPPNYKWVALFVSTLGMLMATIDGSITLIALPDIFRGIHIDPLETGNSFYLLWMILGFLVVTSVLVTSLGRLGDIYGRVRIYNLGFAVFTVFSLLLTVTWMSGTAAGIWLIVLRIFQGVGAAMLMANSAAILTDAFPVHQRGMAMGVNQAAAFSGTFIGLVLGGVLAPVNWRLIFLVSVPVGVLGTVMGYVMLRELSQRRPARVDWPGNITFAVGLVLVMVGITYGIEPYGHDTMGWTNPMVLGCVLGGLALLVVFGIVETRVPQPMFRLQLFKIRAFTAGVFAGFLAALARGGLMFMLIIWLQGIWLPLHGYSFASTPLWAGIAMLPLTAGFLIAGPISGVLSDRFGPRPFATGGMITSAVCFALLELMPADFSYGVFAVLLFFTGMSMSSFGSPNRAGVMNSLPAEHRGAGSGMNTTFQNSAQVLSIGIFFTLLIVGLSSSLSASLYHGLVAHGVSPADARQASSLPPVSTLFAAFLGYNPVGHLIGAHALAQLPHAQQQALLGRSFFPSLITGPFRDGLHAALDFAIVGCLLAAAASWVRGPHVRPDLATATGGSAISAAGGGSAISAAGGGEDRAGNPEVAATAGSIGSGLGTGGPMGAGADGQRSAGGSG
ncbi:MAG TPA: MFS transporter [Acidimicrobiales bacterium]|nr:MFS transporter [Acidimicrobiales bacterium]